MHFNRKILKKCLTASMIAWYTVDTETNRPEIKTRGSKIVEKRYEQYVKDWHMMESAETQPKSFEEWKAMQDEKAAEAKAAEQITTYAPFVGQDAEDKWEAQDIIREMRKIHDAECEKLRAAGNMEQHKLHCIAFDAARKAIMAPFKGGPRPKGPFTATNIYDNDNNPTSY